MGGWEFERGGRHLFGMPTHGVLRVCVRVCVCVAMGGGAGPGRETTQIANLTPKISNLTPKIIPKCIKNLPKWVPKQPTWSKNRYTMAKMGPTWPSRGSETHLTRFWGPGIRKDSPFWSQNGTKINQQKHLKFVCFLTPFGFRFFFHFGSKMVLKSIQVGTKIVTKTISSSKSRLCILTRNSYMKITILRVRGIHFRDPYRPEINQNTDLHLDIDL